MPLSAAADILMYAVLQDYPDYFHYTNTSNQAVKSCTTASSFAKTGIIPVNLRRVLEQLPNYIKVLLLVTGMRKVFRQCTMTALSVRLEEERLTT